MFFSSIPAESLIASAPSPHAVTSSQANDEYDAFDDGFEETFPESSIHSSKKVSFCEAFYRSGSIGVLMGAVMTYINPVGSINGKITKLVGNIPGASSLRSATGKVINGIAGCFTPSIIKRKAHKKTERIFTNLVEYGKSHTANIVTKINETIEKGIISYTKELEERKLAAELRVICSELEEVFINRAQPETTPSEWYKKIQNLEQSIAESEKQLKKIDDGLITSEGFLWNDTRPYTKSELAEKQALEQQLNKMQKEKANLELKLSIICEKAKKYVDHTAKEKYNFLFTGVPAKYFEPGFLSAVTSRITNLGWSDLLSFGLAAKAATDIVTDGALEEGITLAVNKKVDELAKGEIGQLALASLKPIIYDFLDSKARKGIEAGAFVLAGLVTNSYVGSFVWNQAIPRVVSFAMGYFNRDTSVCSNPAENVAKISIGVAVIIVGATTWKLINQWNRYKKTQNREKDDLEVSIENALKAIIKHGLEMSDNTTEAVGILAVDAVKSTVKSKKQELPSLIRNKLKFLEVHISADRLDYLCKRVELFVKQLNETAPSKMIKNVAKLKGLQKMLEKEGGRAGPALAGIVGVTASVLSPVASAVQSTNKNLDQILV